MRKKARKIDRRWSILARVGTVSLLVAVLPSPCWSLELAGILERVQLSPPARAGVVEQRHNPLFEEPLELSGYLEYSAPGSLSKVVEVPFRETFRIESGTIQLSRAGETRDIPAAAGRALEAVLGAIEAILSGNVAGLDSVFTHEVGGTESDWTISLVPRSRRLERHISQIRVSGDTHAASMIVIELDEGEWHEMEILHDAPAP